MNQKRFDVFYIEIIWVLVDYYCQSIFSGEVPVLALL